ncbi:cytochrome d ubiquinol oxidase subunit II [Guptibacillus algicola]|uniref:cytochrome d ubiquinol oxidase subunit II n=1 Tax=Guptibacillus algicola TaxID=225844 RepID=UPI001CD70097|nr:cytochrome d ubiquinol oxidase subunit II [Alkalihalobacillus algicola]MCA0986302.1 cytochrome d ubiquinol oxidase subunit II [Alkalihalobacillus algicola]
MSEALYAITLIWGIVFIYAVMATIDFGAGFWSMIYLNKNNTKATSIANRYLSPSWEVTNVFIVAIVVALFSFFPGATFTLGTVLLIPGSLIILFLAIRSAFLVFSHSATEKYKKILSIISGITGFLIPALLIAVLPITQGGFITPTEGAGQLDIGALFTSFNVYAYMAFAISSTLFLSSLLLADYSNVAGDSEAYTIYRRDAILVGPISLVMAALIVLTIRTEAQWLFENLLDYTPWLIGSVVTFFIGYIALFIPRKKGTGIPRLAMISVVIQYLLASYAYGSAHLPYIVYPDVTIETGFTNPATFRALIITYIVAFFILTPGFIYFWRLFLKDKRYLKQNES